MIILFILLSLSSALFAEKITVPDGFYPGWEKFEGFKGYDPYITEFGYRSISDHVIDECNKTFDPSLVKPGDTIYVGVWFLNWFQDNVHDKIPNPYILITCDVGGYIPNPGLSKLIYDPKVVCWFAKNMIFTNHSKFYQLPMGQFYHQWMQSVGPFVHELTGIISTIPKEKDIFLYLNYTERDYGRRNLVADKFWDKPYCFNRNRPRRPTGFNQFWNELARSKFVLSPLGMEVDCTRTWESFILGAIPIVEHSFLDPLYDKLPILLVHDWDGIDETYLNRKYDEIKKQPVEIERAYLPYWAKYIQDKKEKIQRGDLSMSALESQNYSEEDLTILVGLINQYKKTKTPILYQGNLTTYRPYQLSRKLPGVTSFYLFDTWTLHGLNLMHKQLKDRTLIEKSRVQIRPMSDIESYLASPNKTIILDLTHFRHKLFKEVSELDDFYHSLESDIRYTFQRLYKGEILIGNQAKDPYVSDVLSRLGIPYETKGNFFVLKR